MVDTPQRIDDFKIIEGEVIKVVFYAECASSFLAWGTFALGLEGFGLLGTTILSYQSRESHWLGILLYSHSVFLIIRVVVAATAMRLSTASSSYNLTSTRRISTLEDNAPKEGARWLGMMEESNWHLQHYYPWRCHYY